MSSIGIIANPASGKDIRRLVSHATVFDNHEKVNIVERIILASQACGVKKIYFMPDTFQIGYRVMDNLTISKELKADIKMLDMKIDGDANDTINASRLMEDAGAGCIIVLGGDGTNRAAAKGISNTPMMGLSTGTNNVYPQMIEGTVAGMAAAVVASHRYDSTKTCKKDKRIEIYKNEKLIDVALIDAVVSKNIFLGARAIWNIEDMLEVVVSRAHPASIGFSSVVGCRMIVTEDDDFGAYVSLTEKKDTILAPIAAGLLMPIESGHVTKLNLNEAYLYKCMDRGTIAVDGEREIPFQAGEEITFKITRNGPWRVDIKKTLEIAQQNRFFQLNRE